MSVMITLSTSVTDTVPTNVANTISIISIIINIKTISILYCKKTMKTWDISVNNIVN